MARRKSKQKGRILKKMSCDCKKGEHDGASGNNFPEKKLFGCECVITSMGNRVKGEKFVSDIGVMDISWLNSPDQYGDFTTDY